MSTIERVAVITGHSGERTIEEIRRFLPSNYQATEVARAEHCLFDPYPYHRVTQIEIRGYDVAGWTLDGYVIPRLASGLIWAKEVTQ